MKILFYCPIYNEVCETCNDRFKCWTTKSNYELWSDKYDSCLLHLDICAGMNCFKVEPLGQFSVTLSNWHDGGVDIHIHVNGKEKYYFNKYFEKRSSN